MNEKYHEMILPIITEGGEMGVNEIAKKINLPVSTVQKYLERQNYFRKTERRKWDLPHKVTSDIKAETLALMVSSVESALQLLRAQFAEMQQSVDNTIVPLNTLKSGIKTIIVPVADKPIEIDPQLLEADKLIKNLQTVFKKFVGKCPEEYQELIKNVDLGQILVVKGLDYVNDVFSTEISSLFLEQTDKLSDEILDTLETYQKETN